ncbi:MAG: hypothetical protein HY574_02605 [candidate division NC10 bacterium]|nr:hypothetical protein [candidate division NC10 bacterium]
MPDTPSKLETIERVLKAIREGALLVVLFLVLYYIGPHLSRIASQLGGARVDQVEVLGIKLKVQQAEETLQAAVKAEAPQKGPEDKQVSEQTKLIADALKTLRTVQQVSATSTEPVARTLPAPTAPPERKSFWVYLGARRGTAWLTRNFDTQEVPAVNTSIRARVDVFRRRHPPVFRDGEWVMGDPVGVLQSGEMVKVTKLERVPGTENRELWWAEVAPK